jgi:O-antigen/teichoic acid export membrane protein
MTSRFKKDVAYYLIGIIIPGGLNFAAIPVFKNLLGDGNYGKFNLLFTSLIVLNTALVGWVGHSYLRLSAATANKWELAQHSVQISLYSTLLILLPVTCVLHWLDIGWLEILFYLLILLLSSHQITLTAIAQANFKARLIMLSESLRVTVFFLGGWLLLKSGPNYGVAKLFGASMGSYMVSNFVLRVGLGKIPFRFSSMAVVSKTALQFIQYGFSLALWFLLNYCLQFVDRYFIAFYAGSESSGNYAAVFDLISRSITMMAAPLLSASFPIVAKEFESGNNSAVIGLLRKLVAIELLGLFLAIAAYYMFGYNLIAAIVLHRTAETGYQLSGLFILVGTFLLQLGMLFHKKLELYKNTRQMLVCMSISLGVSLLLNLLWTKPYGVVGASAAYLSATAVYLILVGRSHPVNFLFGLKNFTTGKKDR